MRRRPGVGRLDGGVALVVGAAIVVAGLTAFSPSRAADGDRLIALVDEELTDQGLADHAFDLDTWTAAAAELEQGAVPFLATSLGRTPEAFTADLRATVPAVDRALTTLPDALPFARRILDNLARQQANFEAAQDLPGPGLSLEAGAWLLVAAGAALAGLGAVVLATGRRSARIGVAVTAAVLVIAPLATSFPGNADRTADLLATLNFDREVAVRTRTFFEVTRDLFAAVDAEIVPATARAGGFDEATVAAAIRARFPTLGTALDRHDEITSRFEARVRIREQAVDDLRGVKEVPLRALGWLVVGAGGVVLAAGGTAGLAARQPMTRSVTSSDHVRAERN
jgi:hypothetical protein